MDKLTPADPETRSADPVAENLARLRALFPELVTEGADGVAVNVDVLKQLVGDRTITDVEEQYGLTWHGKRQARQLALTPSTGTLRPCPAESVDWETTRNLMIEGDNLEVLKLLQKSYAGQVKLIYIDPPYNTGKDFVYPDNFQDNLRNYLELTGQVEGGRRISSNTEASGRFHTDWLNMMYPRLKLARNLLREDGVIFISIDDKESHNVRQMMNEIFGEDCFIADVTVVNNLKGRNDKRYIAHAHERVLMYVRSDRFSESGLELPEDRLSEYKGTDAVGKFRLLGLRKRGGADTRELRKNMYFPFYADPDSGQLSLKPTSQHTVEILPFKSDGTAGCWRWGQETSLRNIASLVAVQVGPSMRWDVFEKDYLEQDGTLRRLKPKSVMAGTAYSTDTATKQYKTLMPDSGFANPKPVAFVEDLVEYSTLPGDGDLVLDFFAGSGTTGEATWTQNAADGGNRRVLLVQLPEPLAETNADQATAAAFCHRLGKPRHMAELTKERLRRAGAKIKAENPLFAGDVGFRVFKLDSTNLREWDPRPADVGEAVQLSIEHLKTDRSEADILYELLLKLGLDLCVPLVTRTIAGAEVHAVGGGVLVACLTEKIPGEAVEALALGIVAWLRELAPAGETTCVFRDGAFGDDVAKTNLTEILRQHGVAKVRSL